MRRARRLPAVLVAAALIASAASAAPVGRGTEFPLSDGATPSLITIEVQHITSDNTIDVAVPLTPPKPLPTSSSEFLMQLGELCLRYQADIVAASVKTEDRRRLNVFVPLYRVPVPGTTNQFNEQGFAFRVIDGECSLDAPFPAELKAMTLKRAGQPLGGD